jgi:Ca2+-binding RTX toxin-like protein
VNAPDFETREDAGANNVYDLEVRATDALGESTTQAISVSVTNVNEPGQRFNGGNGNQTIVGTTGDDDMDGGNGRDTLNGGDGNDKIDGGNDNDILIGGRGDDRIEGGNGDDTMMGGDGNDTLNGENDNDVLTGGAGNDRLTGGSGSDLFVFGAGFGKDIVTDFAGNDRIVFDDGLFDTFQEVRAASRQVGSSVVITLDADNTITLQHVNLNSLQANDFLFLS